ncbi:MAG TPA: hypothetical protein GX707_12260 [Epulopiscium sp.]|nr:hypothetical protein [Candidatus Epulonipiscium sp.]
MNIEFTKEEFKALFDLVYAGNMVVNGMRNNDERVKEYCEIEQKIFSLAEEFELKGAVLYDESVKEYVPTRTYEESEVNEYMDYYDEAVFWEELTLRLARRDALNILGDQEPDMSKAKLAKLQLDIEDEYERIFLEGGISDLKLIEKI